MDVSMYAEGAILVNRACEILPRSFSEQSSPILHVKREPETVVNTHADSSVPIMFDSVNVISEVKDCLRPNSILREKSKTSSDENGGTNNGHNFQNRVSFFIDDGSTSDVSDQGRSESPHRNRIIRHESDHRKTVTHDPAKSRIFSKQDSEPIKIRRISRHESDIRKTDEFYRPVLKKRLARSETEYRQTNDYRDAQRRRASRTDSDIKNKCIPRYENEKHERQRRKVRRQKSDPGVSREPRPEFRRSNSEKRKLHRESSDGNTVKREGKNVLVSKRGRLNSNVSRRESTTILEYKELPPKDWRHKKVSIAVLLVSFFLLLASVLIVVISLRNAPTIDEKLRKENEDLLKVLNQATITNGLDSVNQTTTEKIDMTTTNNGP